MPAPWKHCLVGSSLLGVDLLLSSPLVEASLGIRGLAAMAVSSLGCRWIDVQPDGDLLRWNRAAPGLLWAARLTLIACGVLGAAAVLAWAGNKALVWHYVYRPLVISSKEEAAGFAFVGLVAAPLVEELIYRGLVQSRLRDATSPAVAVVFSGPIFWLLHCVAQNRLAPVQHCLAGWILAFACERTRSLAAPMVLHSLGNLLLLALDLVALSW